MANAIIMRLLMLSKKGVLIKKNEDPCDQKVWLNG